MIPYVRTCPNKKKREKRERKGYFLLSTQRGRESTKKKRREGIRKKHMTPDERIQRCYDLLDLISFLECYAKKRATSRDSVFDLSFECVADRGIEIKTLAETIRGLPVFNEYFRDFVDSISSPDEGSGAWSISGEDWNSSDESGGTHSFLFSFSVSIFHKNRGEHRREKREKNWETYKKTEKKNVASRPVP